MCKLQHQQHYMQAAQLHAGLILFYHGRGLHEKNFTRF